MRRARFGAAVSFLTRVPMGAAAYDAEDIGRSAGFFPLVGALLGAFVALVCAAGTCVWPMPVAAMVAVALGMLATGGLHQDALADALDGFGGGSTRARVLEIMRDSRVGAYGALALVVAVGLRTVALASWTDLGTALSWCVVAGATSRWSSLLVGFALPYARTESSGLGRAVSDLIGRRELALATAFTVGLAVAWLQVAACAVLALGGGVAWAMGRWMHRRIGGVTGDTLGAVAEVCEIAILLLGVALGGSR